MTDKNGIIIKAGDIVKIEGAYFKNDNGYWYVEQDGTNPAYLGKDLTLVKIGKRGKISSSKYNLCFWPILCFVSDSRKRAEAYEHNAQHATIEIVHDVDNSEVVQKFLDTAKEHEENAEYYRMRGYHEDCYKTHEQAAAYFREAVKNMTK